MSTTTPELEASNLKLYTAAAEIEEVLKKHDIAGVILLTDSEVAHWLYSLEASWSAAKMTGSHVQITCKADENFTKEQVQKRVTDTIKMVMSLLHLTDVAQKNFLALMLTIQTKFDLSNPEIEELEAPERQAAEEL